MSTPPEVLTDLQTRLLLRLNDARKPMRRSDVAMAVGLPQAVVADGPDRAEFRNAWNPLKDGGYVCEHARPDGVLEVHITRRGHLHLLNAARRVSP